MFEQIRQFARNAEGNEDKPSPLVTSGIENSDFIPQDTGASRSYERYMVDRIIDLLGKPALRIELWDGYGVDGQTARGEAAAGARITRLVGTIRIKTRSALNHIVKNLMIGLGDEYSAGRVEVDGDLIDVISECFTSLGDQQGVLGAVQKVMMRKPRANTLGGAKQNIQHHYDLDNSFYSLWLDHEMQYTCAYFAQDGFTLEDAQIAKMDHVCRKLRLKPGDRVVEAGCGWGGLARHMALYYGARVTAYNISSEQIKFARARAQREGYKDRIEYVEDDYRNISGEYDAFVSVGMLEHVGLDAYSGLGEIIVTNLVEDGRGLIHTIGRNSPQLMNPWIEKRIFPGACPPALREMMDIFEPNDLCVLDVENLRLHYARTLEHWLYRFNRAEDKVRDKFDPVFVRLWRLYLSGSVAAFLCGNLQLFQVTFSPVRDNTIPWTRDHIYSES